MMTSEVAGFTASQGHPRFCGRVFPGLRSIHDSFKGEKILSYFYTGGGGAEEFTYIYIIFFV